MTLRDPGECPPTTVPSLANPAPFVIPAKAGIQGVGRRAARPPYIRKDPDASKLSSLCVPAPAGMSDWYENGLPVDRFVHSGESRNPEGWRRWHAIAGTRCHQSTPFSYLGVPAPAGMCDWYESMSRTPIRDGVTRPRVCPHSTAPTLVIPATHSSFPRRRESRRAGAGGHFHALGVPAPAGMSDRYEIANLLTFIN